jgi:hypothetical protein
MKEVDIIIIGSGMAGLYSAYTLKKLYPKISFLILEQNKKSLIGGRASNNIFYGSQIVTGAGIGRKAKDKLLYKLLRNFNFHPHEFISKPYYSKLIQKVDITKIMNYLRKNYNKNHRNLTFKEFANKFLTEDEYNNFILSSGYTDYENEDAHETLYYYGMEDNTCCWTAFSIPWKKLVNKLYNFIGNSNFKFSNKVININKQNDHFIIETENGNEFKCNKVIIATTINGIRNLLPHKIYNDIEGQPFLRLYAKLTNSSIPIMKEYVKGFTFLPGPLQRIIPMDPDNGIYMIAYNDNKNTIKLSKYLANTKENRKVYEILLEKALGLPKNSIDIIAIKDYYWSIGTHYYKPLNLKEYKNRNEFIDKVQHPTDNILVVGEVVSHHHGWVEGALESVKLGLTKKFILNS